MRSPYGYFKYFMLMNVVFFLKNNLNFKVTDDEVTLDSVQKTVCE